MYRFLMDIFVGNFFSNLPNGKGKGNYFTSFQYQGSLVTFRCPLSHMRLSFRLRLTTLSIRSYNELGYKIQNDSMISSKKIEEGQSQIISRTLEIKKILGKPARERMPFETIEVCHFLSKIYLFKLLYPNESDNLTNVAMSATIQSLNANTELYKEGDDTESLYLIIKGSVQLTYNGTIFNLSRCSTFGELEILFKLDKRLSSVVTTSDVWCIIISKQLLLGSSERKYKIEQIYNFFDRNPYFGSLNRLQKLFLSTKSEKVKFNEGSYILHIGQVPDKVLCVLGGTVSVLKSVTKKQKIYTYEIDVLEQGSIIGQCESITETKSQIALYCRTGVSCFFINMGDIKNHAQHLVDFFNKHQMTYPDSKQIMDILKQQQKEEHFKTKEKRYLVPKKEKLR